MAPWRTCLAGSEIVRFPLVFEMHSSSRLPYRYTPPALLTISLFVIYLRTLAPGLTWANDGSDGGDLIAAAATGGVAHPTGYPLYLLLARISFNSCPSVPWRFGRNLLSALATVAVSVLVYLLVRDFFFK